MSSGQGDVEAGKAYVRVTASDQQALKAIDRFAKRFQAMGQTVAGVGVRMAAASAAALGGLFAATYAYADAAGAAVDASDRLGVAVEKFTGLAYAAEQGGAGSEVLEAGMRKMHKTIADARGGSESATAALAALGVTLQDLEGKSPDEQLKMLADGVASIDDPAQKTAATMDVFGKSGTALIPMLNEGSDGIAKMVARADELGAVMKDKDARAADDFGDQLGDLKKAMRGAVNIVGSALIPIFSSVVETFTNIAVSVRRFIDENRDAVRVVFTVAASLGAAAGVLLAFGAAMKGIGFALSLVAPLIAAVKIGAAAIAAVFAFLVSPIGLAIAAVAALGAYLVYTTSEGGAMLDWFAGKFRQLAADAVEAWGGISAALAAGDLGLAARIAFSFVALEAAKAYKAIWEAWYGFKDWFVGLFTDAWYGAVIVAANVIAKLQTWWEGFKSFFSEAWYGAVIVAANVMAKLEGWWAETVNFLGNTWDRFTGAFMQAWNTATGWLSKQWTKVMGLISDDVDVAAEIKRIDEETAAANDAQQKATDKSIAERDQKKNDRLAQIEQDRAAVEAGAVASADANQQQKNDRLAQIQQDRADAEAGAVMNADAAKAQRSAASDAAIKSMQDGIDADRKAYQELLDEAQRKKAAAEGDPGNGTPPPKRPNALGLNNTLSSKRDESPTGSFNAAASFSFVKVQGPLDRIAEGIDETNELLSEGNRIAEKNAAGMAATP